MKVTISKALLPQVIDKINNLKIAEQYQLEGYSQDDTVINAPSGDVPLEQVIDIARTGARVDFFEYWIEVPNANLADNLPEGVSYRDYETGDPPVPAIRTWAELGELGANGAGTATMRYWQEANNGQFVANDIELIQEAGFEVFGKASLSKKLNADYEDTGDPEYTVVETIEYIDQNWRFAGYFDMLHAHIRMTELYEDKGINDNARWAACTDAEKEIIVRWNIVGLGKAASIMDVTWSENRQLKEIGKKYREFNVNMSLALEKRFTDWYQYLNMILTNSGRTKFNADWDWAFKQEYIHRYLRQYELSSTNALLDFNQTVLSTYLDADFFGTIPASTIVNALERVLNDKTYMI